MGRGVGDAFGPQYFARCTWGLLVLAKPLLERWPSAQVWDKALEARMDRNTTFVALGGGVIGDMCGFAAAAYQRGVHFIQARRLLPPWLQVALTAQVGHGQALRAHQTL